MKTITHLLSFLMLATCLQGCGSCHKTPEGPNKPDDSLLSKKFQRKLLLSQWLITQHMADSLVAVTQARLKMAPPPAPRPALGDNIWQYIFSTEGIAINKGDFWCLHKAYDRNASKVCIVLEVIPKTGATMYYQGSAECPNICGYQDGSLDQATADYYLSLPLQRLGSKSEAESLMRDPQLNCVHTINIAWKQGIEYCSTHRASLIQVVQTYTEAGLLGEPLLFNIDEYGYAMGGVYRIPMNQLCIVSAADKCMLR